jgi:hypothetical protein
MMSIRVQLRPGEDSDQQRLRAIASSGNVANQSGVGSRNVVRNSFAVLAGYGMALSGSLQPCQGGALACVRGPLGAFYLICNIVFFHLESAK